MQKKKKKKTVQPFMRQTQNEPISFRPNIFYFNENYHYSVAPDLYLKICGDPISM